MMLMIQDTDIENKMTKFEQLSQNTNFVYKKKK